MLFPYFILLRFQNGSIYFRLPISFTRLVMSDYDLWVFSAGAVAPPLQEAVKQFEALENITCRFTAGKPEALLKGIRDSQRGDIISCGAEYVHDEAEDIGAVIKGTRRSLGYRRSVIIVDRDNPMNIESLDDLCREGIRVGIAVGGCLKGVWDDLFSKARLTEKVRRNIVEHADACGSLMGLIHSGKVDAVIGWNAFKNVWPDTCEAIELPEPLQVFRSTAVQTISYTQDRQLSAKLIEFLTSPEGREIYKSNGWIH
jgi:accessory colonization factor AcfC